MRYFVHYKNEKHKKEVTLEEYLRVCKENTPDMGIPDHNIPKIFIGKTASGHVDPEILMIEGILVL